VIFPTPRARRACAGTSVGRSFHSMTRAAPRHSRTRRSASSKSPLLYGSGHATAGAPPSSSQAVESVGHAISRRRWSGFTFACFTVGEIAGPFGSLRH
jgi:hypothetical protein